MKRYCILFFLLLAASVTSVAQVGDLPRSTPEAEGVNPVCISNLYHVLDSNPDVDVHHLMILRHGKVIGEIHASPYKATDKHMLYSASKTVTGLAVGLAVQDGLLSIDDKVSKFLRDKMPATLSSALDSLTVRNMLMMASGRKEDTDLYLSKEDWLTSWFQGDFQGVGTEFHYDSMATHALAMIICRLTGKPLLQYVKERIFDPLHITDFDWELAPDSVEIGGWGLRLHAESEAKLGQLMLQGGQWNGQQLVNEQWIQEMTKCQLVTDAKDKPNLSFFAKVRKWLSRTWHKILSWFTGYNKSSYKAGYGYQTKTVTKPRADAFFAAGYGGQLIYVVPKCDLVVVINGRAKTYGDEHNAFYDYLVVPLVSGDDPVALPKCDAMTVDMPQGEATNPLEQKILGHRIVMGDNPMLIDDIVVNRKGDDLIFTMNDYKGVFRAVAACGEWRYTTGDERPFYIMESIAQFVGTARPFTSVAAYGWQGDTLAMRVDWLDGGDNRRMKMAFDGEDVSIAISDGYDHLLTDTIYGKFQPANERHR